MSPNLFPFRFLVNNTSIKRTRTHTEWMKYSFTFLQLLISMCSLLLYGSLLVYSIIYGIVPSPSRFETRQLQLPIKGFKTRQREFRPLS